MNGRYNSMGGTKVALLLFDASALFNYIPVMSPAERRY
jgi:hypothetical protein